MVTGVRGHRGPSRKGVEETSVRDERAFYKQIPTFRAGIRTGPAAVPPVKAPATDVSRAAPRVSSEQRWIPAFAGMTEEGLRAFAGRTVIPPGARRTAPTLVRHSREACPREGWERESGEVAVAFPPNTRKPNTDADGREKQRLPGPKERFVPAERCVPTQLHFPNGRPDDKYAFRISACTTPSEPLVPWTRLRSRPPHRP